MALTDQDIAAIDQINGLLGGEANPAVRAQIKALMTSNPEIAQLVSIPPAFDPDTSDNASGSTDSDSQARDPRNDPALIAQMKAATGRASNEELAAARQNADEVPTEEITKPAVGGNQTVGASGAPTVETTDSTQPKPEVPAPAMVVALPAPERSPQEIFQEALAERAAQKSFEVAMTSDAATGQAVGREILNDNAFASNASVAPRDRATGRATGDINSSGLDTSAATAPNAPLTLAALVDPSQFPDFAMADYGKGAGRTGKLNPPATENNVTLGNGVVI